MSNTRISTEVISEIRTNQRYANMRRALNSIAQVAAASNRNFALRADESAPTMTMTITTTIPSPNQMPKQLGENLQKVHLRTPEEQAELDSLVAEQAAEQEAERIAKEQANALHRQEHPDEYPDPKEEYYRSLREDSSYNPLREELKLRFADKRRGESNVDVDYNGAPDPNDDPIDPGFVGQGMHIEVR